MTNRFTVALVVNYSLLSTVLVFALVFFSGSTHTVTHANENHLPMPFTHLWLLWLGLVLMFSGKLGVRIGSIVKFYLWGALALVGVGFLLKFGANSQDNWMFLAGVALADVSLTAGVLRACFGFFARSNSGCNSESVV